MSAASPRCACVQVHSDQTVETETHRITSRWRNGVAAGMRFAKQGRIFDIVTVHDPDDTGCYLVCRPMEAGP
jgi:SPP1 family predicted phage head-tail adaptor